MFNFSKKTQKEPENLKEILTQFKKIRKEFAAVSEELSRLKKEAQFSVKKIGIVRFNPFSEVGSDLSFSVAFLDGNDNGVVISSLYSREENRIFAKAVKSGQSQHPLSEEEKEAIKKAINGTGGAV